MVRAKNFLKICLTKNYTGKKAFSEILYELPDYYKVFSRKIYS
jgi:hypothetical protein